MDPNLAGLLNSLEDESEDVREAAALELGMFLEMRKRNIHFSGYTDRPDFYREYVREALIQLSLSRELEKAIVNAALERVDRDPVCRGLAVALRYVDPRIAAEGVLRIVTKKGTTLDEIELREWVTVILELFVHGAPQDEEWRITARNPFKEYNLETVITMCESSTDVQLRDDGIGLRAEVVRRRGTKGPHHGSDGS